MPDTLFALAVLIVLILPGAVFAIQVDNKLPTRELSSLRELAAVAGVGFVCDACVLLPFGIIRALLPGVTPDVGAIERGGAAYLKLHPVSTGWWFITLFLASCGLAYTLGRFRPGIAGRVVSGKIGFNSAWWELFTYKPNTYKYIGCELQDGSYIAGYLMRYSSEIDETGDRSLALSAPISYRPANSREKEIMSNVGAVIVSADQLKFLTVSYRLPADALKDSGRQG